MCVTVTIPENPVTNSSRVALFLLCIYVGNAYGVDLLTVNEQRTLDSLKQEFSVDDMLISANDRLSLYNKRKHAHADLLTEIELKKTKYQELIAQLPEVIRAKGNAVSMYTEIETLVTTVQSLEGKVESESRALKIDYELIQAEYRKIENARANKNERLLALKAEITKRIVDDLAGSGSAQARTRDGTVSCSKFKTMLDCLKDAKTAAMSREVENDPFIDDKSVLLSYEVLDATMNLSGNLKYRVEMVFKPSYNSEIDALLNEKLGLNSAVVKLISNVEAEWFIDGVRVGKGKQISQSVPLGRHIIVASYGSDAQSTVEFIQSSGEYRYNFASAKRSGWAKPRKKKPAPAPVASKPVVGKPVASKDQSKPVKRTPVASEDLHSKSNPVPAISKQEPKAQAEKVCFGKNRCY
ncbi:MAG: hypothetical protein GKR94_00310 [Gammaproteobacteria bacterium]|nr:hypothetical protein [Gammaproteobacteria bacterium]